MIFCLFFGIYSVSAPSVFLCPQVQFLGYYIASCDVKHSTCTWIYMPTKLRGGGGEGGQNRSILSTEIWLTEIHWTYNWSSIEPLNFLSTASIGKESPQRSIEDILNMFQLLCAKGTHTLQTKSKLAEDSVQELINLIMNYDDPNLQTGTESDSETVKDEDKYAG